MLAKVLTTPLSSLKIWGKEMLTVNIINDMYFYRLNFKYILIKR